jgi:hypothetical protein
MPSPLIEERFSAAERLLDEYATAREARDQCIILVAGLRQVLEGLRQLAGHLDLESGARTAIISVTERHPDA